MEESIWEYTSSSMGQERHAVFYTIFSGKGGIEWQTRLPRHMK